MLYTCAARFDVTGNLKNLAKFFGHKHKKNGVRILVGYSRFWVFLQNT